MSRDRTPTVTALDGTPVPWGEAESRWSAVAYDLLVQLAGHYQAIVEDHTLAKELQLRTNLQTSSPTKNWLPRVLRHVTSRATEAGAPPLATLVVGRHDGQVGEVYDDVCRATGLEPLPTPEEREDRAAQARLECYRWAGAVARHRGTPALSPKLQKQREREQREKLVTHQVRTGSVCPTCGLTMALTGVCDFCS
ncbi:hypothetical protein [Kribbia dieselivorans]|uniref:hypothetical protein n=1 Tax=Kribbia dieselivorans TaxID=331526 RepID=UPI0008382C58|nr:hypothetical protein [Kribbia dieselivorans]